MTLTSTDRATESPLARAELCTIVLVRAEPGLDAPIARLSTLLADAVSALFGEAAAVLHLARPDGEPRAARREIAGEVRHVWLETPGDGRAHAILEAEIARSIAAGSQYVFLDASRLDPAAAARVEPRVTQLIHLTREDDGPLPPAPPGCAVLRTVVLAEDSAPKLSTDRVRLADVLRRMMVPPRTTSPEGWGAPYPEARPTPAWCRIRLDFPALESMREPSFHALPSTARQTFGRWARALTRRRVGLALGGSGAWGYASAALILELCERGVPVDLVAGASSGALIAAYYCAAGVEGVQRIIENGPVLERGMPLMALSSVAVEHAVNAELGFASLSALEIPFLPVATNLSLLRAEVIRGGTIGFGVRASGSAPGLFATTTTRDAIYVDGAVSDNVPIALVEAMGADLVIATNPLPAGLGPRANAGGWGPLSRLRDFAVSFELMLHLAGEHAPTARRIVYSAEPASAPLLSTFGYSASARIVDQVRTRDARFRAAVEASAAAFRDLSRPRR